MIDLVSLVLVMLPSSALFNGVAMRQVVDAVYVEEPATDADRRAVIKAVNAAYTQLRDAFSEDRSFEAVVFICRTATCKRAFGASPRVAHADEPSCVGFAPASEMDVTGFATKADWQAALEKTGETLRMYCQARYATEAWSSFRGKRELAVRARALAESVAHGGATGSVCLP